jgi:aspartyl-tRNA(Asn)/glutamyl-tRNA(Gln) amidotransferase subunit B
MNVLPNHATARSVDGDAGVDIGLEIHVQLDTRSKLFCGDAVHHAALPNTDVCPVCLGLPGALPVLNQHAVELAVRAATMLQCTIHRTSRFVRKSYFYPDLPKGYQITQLEEPLGTDGLIVLDHGAIRLSRVHLEEDAGKLLHDRVPGRTAIDLNRCGIPLLEIVTHPDLHSAADAATAARELKHLLQYGGISDCDMELGELRIDANVSIRHAGADGSDVARTELKNINSFSQLERAIELEIERQQGLLDAGERVISQTLAWDEHHGALRVLRTKEQRTEYRYFDEPDLPPVIVGRELLDRACAHMPELPRARAARLVSEHGLHPAAARSIVATRELADYFDDVVACGAAPRAASTWLLGTVLAWCNASGRTIASYPVRAGLLAELLKALDAGALTRDGARTVLHALEKAAPQDVVSVASGVASQDAADLNATIEALGVRRHVDEKAIDALVDRVLKEEASLAARYKAGEKNLFGFLMGTVMSRAGASVDPRVVAEHLRTRLQE